MTTAHVILGAAGFLLLVASPVAEAGSSRKAQSGPAGASAPVKHCTRLNGRFGYYGNPWCTEAEQRRFDLWEARRHSK